MSNLLTFAAPPRLTSAPGDQGEGGVPSGPLTRTVLERFESKISPEPMSGCWLWTGTTGRGYGRLYVNGKNEGAHRVSWYLAHGEWPKLLVCHKCDVPSCVNPNHLFLGTSVDNSRDMAAKGRARRGEQRGEKNPRAKLTAVTAAEIRNSSLKVSELARIYAVSWTTIYDIKAGMRWQNV